MCWPTAKRPQTPGVPAGASQRDFCPRPQTAWPTSVDPARERIERTLLLAQVLLLVLVLLVLVLALLPALLASVLSAQ